MVRGFVVVAITQLAILVQSASAYQFFQSNVGGGLVPQRWLSLGVQVVVDNGPTDVFTDVQTAVNAWNNIETARDVFGTVSRAVDGMGNPVDFNLANRGTAWGVNGDGIIEVVVDEDGSIFTADLVGPTVLGYAPPVVRTSGSQSEIFDGIMVIRANLGASDRISVLTHEFGHNQGVAHSTIGMHRTVSAPSVALDPISSASVATMMPFILPGIAQRTPEQDDIAALSELYPEASFATSLGGISGTVTRCVGDNAVLGANVRAVSQANSQIQVSRYSAFDGNTAGRFVINGLPPGSYRLLVEPMNVASFTGRPPGRNRMAIQTRLDDDFPTEYFSLPDEPNCVEALPARTPTSRMA